MGTWALDRINSSAVRSKALFALGALLRHHPENRNMFSQKIIRIAREDKPQPTLHRLLTLAFHSPYFSEQISTAYAFANFLHENAESQLAIVTTLTPPPDSEQTSNLADAHAGANSIGRQLLKSLQEGYKQPATSWIASWILSCVVAENADCKQVAQRIQLSLDKPGETLLVLCMSLLRSNQALVKQRNDLASQIASVGFLRLLGIWMYQYPPLVDELLRTSENLTFLIDLINQPDGNEYLQGMCTLLLGFCFMFNENEDPDDTSTNRLALHGIICHRIGLDKFMEKIDGLRGSEAFVNAEKTEITSLDLIEFVKNAKDQLLRDLRSPNKRKADSIHKDQMKEKDKEILNLKEQIKELEEKLQAELQKQNEGSALEVSLDQQLKEALGKIQLLEEELESKEIALQSLSQAYTDLESHLSSTPEGSSSIQNSALLKEKNAVIQQLEESKKELENTISELRSEVGSGSELQKINEKLENELKGATAENQRRTEAETKIQNLLTTTQKRFQDTLKQLQEQSQENKKLENIIKDLELQLSKSKLENESLQTSASNTAAGDSTLAAQLQETDEKLRETQKKFDELQKDHEDLLIMFVQSQSQ